jgi:phosphate transport system permease protein
MSFGVNSLLLTTLQVAFGALFIAVPLGVGCAIYLSEYASPRLVSVVKPTLELLAGIPSVVYGFFAFIYIGPLVVELGEFAFAKGWIDQPPNILNPINGAIVVGVMILPLVASMSEDALRAVPNELREGSLALGATRIETTLRVMLQAALSGILASIILALSRAVGETMAVTLAVGTVAVYTSNMFLPAQTMTAYIAQRVGGDLPFGEIGYLTIFAVGLYLFMITLSLNLLGNKVLSAYREAY